MKTLNTKKKGDKIIKIFIESISNLLGIIIKDIVSWLSDPIWNFKAAYREIIHHFGFYLSVVVIVYFLMFLTPSVILESILQNNSSLQSFLYGSNGPDVLFNVSMVMFLVFILYKNYWYKE